jgi:hypothetical protein
MWGLRVLLGFCLVMDDLLKEITPEAQESCEVVKLSNFCYSDSKGCVHVEKRLTPMKRKSYGYQVLQEDIKMIGTSEVISRIINLQGFKDGIYSVITCHEKRDWESGYVEEYDYKLIPFVGGTNANKTT